jgi:dienelactone hydrolase
MLARDSLVDRRRIAAMGYSTGGDVALLLQGRNPLVHAVVGLDASWTLGPGNDVIESSLFDPSRHRVPILAARRPIDDRDAADELLGVLTAAPRLVVEIPGGNHGTFSDDPAQRLLLGASTETGAAGHALMTRAVLAFLKEVLQDEAGEFDAAGLAKRLDEEGVVVRFHAAEPDEPGD